MPIGKSSWWVTENNPLPPEKTVEEIAREAEEEIAEATRLARTGKRHNDMQYNTRCSFEDASIEVQLSVPC
jgi:hypothetical protein